MGLNAAQAFNKALTLFSSLYEDMSPSDLPEGLSPDNQDVWFLPGLVKTRPALTRQLANQTTNFPSIMSLADFPSPSGSYFSIYLDSNGVLWYQIPDTLAIAEFSQTFSPGLQFKSEAAFNKFWMGTYSQLLSEPFSDNPFVGIDPPVYWNSSEVGGFSRVTSDPPGLPPQISSASASFTIATADSIGGSINTAPNGLSMSGNRVTVVMAAGFGVDGPERPGDTIVIAGAGVAGYDGTFVIESIGTTAVGITQTTFFTYISPSTGLGPSGGGMASFNLASIVLSGTAQASDLGNTSAGVVVAGNTEAGFNGTWSVRETFGNILILIIGSTALSTGTGGTINAAGMAGGARAAVMMFKSQDGAITGPSVPVYFNTLQDGIVQVSQALIGPAGTTQRIIAFTPAGGSSFYYITPSIVPSPTGAAPTITQGTIINDNTSTTATFNFTDEALTAATQIDIPGNNLFNQVVLAPCMGVISYAGRLAWWGEINNVKNFINMGFDGGYLPPLMPPFNPAIPPGWSVSGTGGSLSVTLWGFDYEMRSSGGSADAMIYQSCYQDFYGAPILQPATPYTIRCMASQQGALAGNLVFQIFSPTQGVLGSATFAASSLHPLNKRWISASLTTGIAAIPSDAVFRIFISSVTAGALVSIDEVEVINAIQPVLAQQARVSYFDNPFGYDVLTGIIGLNTSESIVGAFKQRDYLYFLTDRSLFLTQDNGTTEPNDWNVSLLAIDCGLASPNAVITEKSLTEWVGQQGLQIFTGETPEKISQEIQPTMDTINWDAGLSIWMANDSVERMLYFGIPTGTSVAPSQIVPMSYRSLRAAYNVPDPMHVSYSGKLIGTELCRKLSRWNMTMNCGAILHRQTTEGLRPIACFGGGNGEAPGSGTNFGEFYSLTFDKHTDDDYGQIFSYYVTYFFFVHDVEESLPVLGSHRHLYSYLSAFVSGIGLVQFTPYMDSLTNPWAGVPLPEYNLSTNPTKDLGWGLNVTCERMALKIAAVPIPVANITEIVILNNVATVYAPNGFAAGMNVAFAGLTNFPILNGTTQQVTAASPSQFSFAFTFADETGTDTGTATLVASGSPLTDAAFSLEHLILSGRLENVFPLASVL